MMLGAPSKTKSRPSHTETTLGGDAPRAPPGPRASSASEPSLSLSVRTQVAHAERFAHTLERLERGLALESTLIWMIGRADEVRVFARETVSDWLRGDIDCAGASAILDEYLTGLHDELRASLGDSFDPSCCRAHSGTMRRDDLAMARSAVRSGSRH